MSYEVVEESVTVRSWENIGHSITTPQMDATYRSRWFSLSIELGSGNGWLSVTPDGPGPMEPPPEPGTFRPWFERVDCARNVRGLGYWSFFWSPNIRIIRKTRYISDSSPMSGIQQNWVITWRWNKEQTGQMFPSTSETKMRKYLVNNTSRSSIFGQVS
jgi:hypothetical protein